MAQLEGAAEQHGYATGLGDLDQALGAMQAAGLYRHNIENVDGLMAQEGQGEGVVEVGYVFDYIGGYRIGYSGEG